MAVVKGRQACRIWIGRERRSSFCMVSSRRSNLPTSDEFMPPMEGFLLFFRFFGDGESNKVSPDKFDLVGGSIALLGVLVIMYWPRN